MRYLYNVLNRIKLHGCRTAALKGNIGENPRQPPLLCYNSPSTVEKQFQLGLFGIFPQAVTRRSAATTSLRLAKIYPKILNLKPLLSALGRVLGFCENVSTALLS